MRETFGRLKTHYFISCEAENYAYHDLKEAEELVYRAAELEELALHELGSRLLLLSEVSSQPEITVPYKERLSRVLAHYTFESKMRSHESDDEFYDVALD